MTMFPRVGEKRRIDDIKLEDEEAIGTLCRMGGRPLSPKTAMEQEKRIRREIANSNERRRMQSINAGFASLKTLLPHHEGEKLSKAAILQQTAEYIYQLEKETTRLLAQNCQLKRLLNQQQHRADAEGNQTAGETACDETITNIDSTTQVETVAPEELRRDLIELKVQQDREKRHRITLEEHFRSRDTVPQSYSPDVPMKDVLHTVRTVNTKPDVRDIKVELAPDIKVELSPASIKAETTSTVAVPTVTPAEVSSYIPPKLKKEPEPKESPPPPRQSPPRPLTTNVPNTVQSPVTTALVTTTTAVPTSIATAAPSIRPASPRQPATATFTRQTVAQNLHNHQIQGTIVSASPATTIVTVVPSKGGVESSVFDALTTTGRFGAKVEVEPAPRVPSPEATIEYVDDSKPQTVYIVNSTSAACQKSLDTICEAIRHLEGDHMFQTEDQHPRIEEEIITEETLTIEDHSGHHVTLTEPHSQMALEEPIALHMVGEPQEVPLELTTTHRPSQQITSSHNVQLHHSLPHQSTISLTTRPSHPSPSHTITSSLASSKEESIPVCSISTTTSSHHSSQSQNVLQVTRPGVIVVKHP